MAGLKHYMVPWVLPWVVPKWRGLVGCVAAARAAGNARVRPVDKLWRSPGGAYTLAASFRRHDGPLCSRNRSSALTYGDQARVQALG